MLSVEEKKRRKSEVNKRYYEKNKSKIRQAQKERYYTKKSPIYGKINEANKRLSEMRKKGYEDMRPVKLAEYDIKKRDSRAEKFSVFKNVGNGKELLTEKEQKLLEKEIDSFLKSKWTTNEGREEIWNKSISSFKNLYNAKDKDAIIHIYEIMSTDVYEMLISQSAGALDSKQVASMLSDISNISSDFSARKIEQVMTEALSVNNISERRDFIISQFI